MAQTHTCKTAMCLQALWQARNMLQLCDLPLQPCVRVLAKSQHLWSNLDASLCLGHISQTCTSARCSHVPPCTQQGSWTRLHLGGLPLQAGMSMLARSCDVSSNVEASTSHGSLKHMLATLPCVPKQTAKCCSLVGCLCRLAWAWVPSLNIVAAVLKPPQAMAQTHTCKTAMCLQAGRRPCNMLPPCSLPLLAWHELGCQVSTLLQQS